MPMFWIWYEHWLSWWFPSKPEEKRKPELPAVHRSSS